MTCPQCGATLHARAQFCGACGCTVEMQPQSGQSAPQSGSSAAQQFSSAPSLSSAQQFSSAQSAASANPSGPWSSGSNQTQQWPQPQPPHAQQPHAQQPLGQQSHPQQQTGQQPGQPAASGGGRPRWLPLAVAGAVVLALVIAAAVVVPKLMHRNDAALPPAMPSQPLLAWTLTPAQIAGTSQSTTMYLQQVLDDQGHADRAVVMAQRSGSTTVAVVDLTNGQIVWKAGLGEQARCFSPLVDDNLVCATSASIQLYDVTKGTITRTITPTTPVSPDSMAVVSDGVVATVATEGSITATKYTADGKQAWTRAIPVTYSDEGSGDGGGPAVAGDRVVIVGLSDQSGNAIVLKASDGSSISGYGPGSAYPAGKSLIAVGNQGTTSVFGADMTRLVSRTGHVGNYFTGYQSESGIFMVSADGASTTYYDSSGKQQWSTPGTVLAKCGDQYFVRERDTLSSLLNADGTKVWSLSLSTGTINCGRGQLFVTSSSPSGVTAVQLSDGRQQWTMPASTDLYGARGVPQGLLVTKPGGLEMYRPK